MTAIAWDPIGLGIRTFQAYCYRRSGNAPPGLFEIVHVAIYLGRDVLIGAAPPHGVQHTYLSQRRSEFVVLRPRWSNWPQDVDLVCDRANASLGASYASTIPLIRIALRQARRGNIPASTANLDALICSTFVIEVFMDALGGRSPFHQQQPLSGLSFFLPADVVTVPTLDGVAP